MTDDQITRDTARPRKDLRRQPWTAGGTAGRHRRERRPRGRHHDRVRRSDCPDLDELTDAEACTVGWAAARGAKALRHTLDPEAVFSAVVGRSPRLAEVHQPPPRSDDADG